MRTFLKFFAVTTIIFGFSACANGKKLQEEKPSGIGGLYYTTWTGGTERSGAGYDLFVELKNASKLQIDSAYFRGKRAAFERVEGDLYVANFRIPGKGAKSPDFIMHEDPKKEYGNPAPVIPEPIPFELEGDEAVLRVVKDGKVKYFKMQAIQKEEQGQIQIKNSENL